MSETRTEKTIQRLYRVGPDLFEIYIESWVLIRPSVTGPTPPPEDESRRELLSRQATGQIFKSMNRPSLLCLDPRTFEARAFEQVQGAPFTEEPGEFSVALGLNTEEEIPYVPTDPK